MNGEKFEWDEAKARRNLAKHGVSFEAATLTFDDPFAVEYLDLESDHNEARLIMTGMVNSVVLTVVYIERGDRIRIISVRKATTHEEREYNRSQTPE